MTSDSPLSIVFGFTGSRIPVLFILLAGCFINNDLRAFDLPNDTTVYWQEGKKIVHEKGDRRYKKGLSQGVTYTKMTWGEAEKRKLKLSSKSPSYNRMQGGGGNLPESWVQKAPDSIATHPFLVSPNTPLISMGSDGRLVYNSYSGRGDRIIDFSYAGYKKSEAPIPDVDVFLTLDPEDNTPRQVGNMKYRVGLDDRQRIQEALDAVAKGRRGPDGSRGAVLLTKGTYYINGSLIVGDGVVLRGEGSGEDGTVLMMQAPKEKSTAIQLKGETGIVQLEGASPSRMLDDYVPSGVMSVRVENARQFKPGDFVEIKKTVNDQWIDDLGMGIRLRHIRGGEEGNKKKPWKASSYQFRLHRQITKVNGDTIEFDMPLIQSFEKKHGSGEVYKVDYSGAGSNGGVEHLRVVSNYDTTVRDESKESYFKNFRTAVSVQNYTDGWVRNVTALHMSFAATRLGSGSRQITVRDSKYLQPFGPDRGGNRYSFVMSGGTGHLVYNCYSEDARHCFSGGSRTQGPYVFLDSNSSRGGQSEPHHRWGTAYLYDNVTTKDGRLAAINRGDSGSGHGWSAANTVFWNCNAQNIVIMDPETDGENNFAFGFNGLPPAEVSTGGLGYANTRAGYWGTPQEGKFFGYPLMGSGHIENPDSPMPIPSLFKAQLAERIGLAQMQKVLN